MRSQSRSKFSTGKNPYTNATTHAEITIPANISLLVCHNGAKSPLMVLTLAHPAITGVHLKNIALQIRQGYTNKFNDYKNMFTQTLTDIAQNSITLIMNGKQDMASLKEKFL